jgi:hypothetical protein
MATVDLYAVHRVLRDKHRIEASIIHTGGGVWCLYVGEVDRDGASQLIAGPATCPHDIPPGFDHRPMLADVHDFYVGPDDDNYDRPLETVARLGATTGEQVADLIARALHTDTTRRAGGAPA